MSSLDTTWDYEGDVYFRPDGQGIVLLDEPLLPDLLAKLRELAEPAGTGARLRMRLKIKIWNPEAPG